MIEPEIFLAMVLNYIWITFFLVAFVVAVGRTLFCGDFGIWSDIMGASFTSAAAAFEIALGLTGVPCGDSGCVWKRCGMWRSQRVDGEWNMDCKK